MKAFKQEMIRLLLEYTGRPELFKKIKFVDINPFLASQLAWRHDFLETEEGMNDGLHTDDRTLGNYSYNEDIIYIRTPKETLNGKCLMPKVYAQTLNVILHEVSHRLQYKKTKHDKNQIHGIEFQKACLELGLVPSIEAYDETEFIEHDASAKEIYQWMEDAGIKHLLTAMEN